jgi:hypothetical protein
LRAWEDENPGLGLQARRWLLEPTDPESLTGTISPTSIVLKNPDYNSFGSTRGFSGMASVDVTSGNIKLELPQGILFQNIQVVKSRDNAPEIFRITERRQDGSTESYCFSGALHF